MIKMSQNGNLGIKVIGKHRKGQSRLEKVFQGKQKTLHILRYCFKFKKRKWTRL